MHILPVALEKLIEQLGKLPGVGARTAERYGLAILRRSDHDATELAEAITNLHSGIKVCPKTFTLIDSTQEISPLYSDASRNKSVVAVIEDALDIVALEKTSQYHGTYHVLGGLLSPIDGIGPENLHIHELQQRIAEDNVTEIILALNASVEGESTAIYIQQQLRINAPDLIITRLARGLPAGLDLEYADQLTLQRALEHRTSL
ncbi:recombination protein RecR [Candidatus Saccharibacteria bacterium]|nr:recombination protein RecR [Candidatus Saccharibacteria bacterium]